MTVKEKISQLQNVIDTSLRPIVNRDYYLLEIPYYTNIGDTLIWQGEKDFLGKFPYKCKGAYALESFRYPSIKETDLIIFQGGGNFGDLWTKHHDFKMSVVGHYPNNEFLFMPQTVYFQEEENMKACAKFLTNFNVTICARDIFSFELLKNNFRNKVLLVPDMAFCINMKRWNRSYVANKPLLLKRIDKELKNVPQLAEFESLNVDISDWPTMYNKDFFTKGMYKSKSHAKRAPWLADFYCKNIYRPYLIYAGIKFLNSHTQIITTRLHGAILSVLLGKETVFIDNTYGKNSQFYNTWLSDCDCIKMIGNE